MADKGFNIICAYSDPAASEIGSVYQASNFLYCGMTSPTEQYRTPDGKIHDSRQIHGLTRDRRNGSLKYTRTRSEQRKILVEQGCEFMDGMPKHRYVGFYGNRRQKRLLLSALQWEVAAYPKRLQPAATNEAPPPDGFDLPIASSQALFAPKKTTVKNTAKKSAPIASPALKADAATAASD
jgi:hypothetical protein